MSSIKHINLYEPEVIDIVKLISGIREAVVEKVKDGSVKVEILTVNNKKALLQIWFTENGATIKYELGENPSISEQIARKIVSKCGYLSDVHKIFKSISKEKIENLINHLKELGISVSTEESLFGQHIFLKWYSNQTLSFTYYPKQEEVLINGKRNRIYEEVEKVLRQI